MDIYVLETAFKELSGVDRDALICTLEQEDTLIINMKGDHFIGVNVPESFKIIERKGEWSYGSTR